MLIAPSDPGLPTIEELVADLFVSASHVDTSATGVPVVSFLGAAPLGSPADAVAATVPLTDVSLVANQATVMIGTVEDSNAWLAHTQGALDMAVVCSTRVMDDWNMEARTALMPGHALAGATRSGKDGATFIDANAVRSRLELVQLFRVNAMGVITLIKTKVEHQPDDSSPLAAMTTSQIDALSRMLASFYGQLVEAFPTSTAAAGAKAADDTPLAAQIVLTALGVIAIAATCVIGGIASRTAPAPALAHWTMVPLGTFGVIVAIFNLFAN